MIHKNVFEKIGAEPYTHACVELRKVELHAVGQVLTGMVLRGQVRVSDCDECGVPPKSGHIAEYIDATIDAQRIDAVRRFAFEYYPHRSSLVKCVMARMRLCGLSGEEISEYLDGRFFSGGKTADVLSAKSTNREDYVFVLAFTEAWSAFLDSAHARINKDWPNRHTSL